MGLLTPINNWARFRSRLIISVSTYEMGTAGPQNLRAAKTTDSQHHKFQLR
jgi:hypothetical protein